MLYVLPFLIEEPLHELCDVFCNKLQKKKKETRTKLLFADTPLFYLPINHPGECVEYRDEEHSQMVRSAISFGQAFEECVHMWPFGQDGRDYDAAWMNRFPRNTSLFPRNGKTSGDQGANNVRQPW